MTEKSRTEYSARNATVAMCSRILAMLAGFVARVVFTHTLSEEYVGINGLFTDILNVLALSELGVGTAITYALYKPISEGNIEKQKALMRMYRNFYRGVAGMVLTLGLLLVPFLGYLFRDQPRVEHLTLIYLLYLANSVLSYTFVYKRTLVDAHQLSYIGVLYQTMSWFAQSLLQIGVLLLTKNFMLYVSVMAVCTIANNLCISAKADRMYPYLQDKKAEKLPEEERKGIFRNIRAMLMHKTSTVIVNSTDNLLLSALVGIRSVGCYTNYFLIIGSIQQVLAQMFGGITASVGNLGVESSPGRVRKIFEASFFMGQWVYGMVAICLYQVLNPFVELFFGSQYVFPEYITLVLCLNFYITGMRQPTLIFRDSLGVFWYDRYKSLAEAVINLVVSWVLGKQLGTIGVFIGTTVSMVTTSLWVEPYMLYRHKLECSSGRYFLRYGIYAAVTFGVWFGLDVLCRQMTGSLFSVCAGRLVCCLLVTNLVYLLVYHRTKEFRLLKQKGLAILHKSKR
ncbi:MAG: lipopolysaccharide biosynthesis protein [Firmicutes bacterium]|nr:lipopolysaccharide biosynthesis protein [Bacillota bacterium]